MSSSAKIVQQGRVILSLNFGLDSAALASGDVSRLSLKDTENNESFFPLLICLRFPEHAVKEGSQTVFDINVTSTV